MSKTIQECLNYFDSFLYKDINNTIFIQETRDKTKRSRESMHILIKHLMIKDQVKLSKILNEVIRKNKEEDYLITHLALLRILMIEFPDIVLDFAKEEKARRFMTSF